MRSVQKNIPQNFYLREHIVSLFKYLKAVKIVVVKFRKLHSPLLMSQAVTLILGYSDYSIS